MHNVAIIGAGQLGSRHLQALALYEHELNIYIIDPSNESLRVSKQRYEAVGCFNNKNVKYSENINDLPMKIDFAVIATTSVQRLNVLNQLLSHSEVRYLLLEKFLFPYIEEYDDALKLISKYNTQSYVNCARRSWPIYQEIRKSIVESSSTKLTVSGSNWNLASNSVHFIDLFFYLTGETDIKIYTSELDHELLSNKRKDYIEISGTLNGISSNNNKVSLTSNKTGEFAVEISIETEKYKFILYEDTGEISILDDKDKCEKKRFEVRKQSELTHLIYEQLLETDTCDLVTFEESIDHHLVLLKAFNDFLGDRNGVVT